MSKKESLFMPLTLFIVMMLCTSLNEYTVKENIYAGNLPNAICSPIFFLTREDVFEDVSEDAFANLRDDTHDAFPKSVNDNAFSNISDGDILITFCSHTFTYRHGHAALVIDAEKGITLEASELGSFSSYRNIQNWNRYTSFSILRLSDDIWNALSSYHQKPRAVLTDELISFAQNNMLNLPYVLSVGIFSEKYTLSDTSYGTNCSHLVWQCYRTLGIDLDSDGGLIVTPKDIYQSPFLITVSTRTFSTH